MKTTKLLKDSQIAGLQGQIFHWESEGWEVIGEHKALITHQQLRYSGMQHKNTITTVEYSITMQLVTRPDIGPG